MTTATDDERIIWFDPWGDDETPTTTFSDRMVITRTSSKCAICFAQIVPGERVRTQVQKNLDDNKVMTFRFCPDCCRAMIRRNDAKNYLDEMAIERRYEIGRKRAGETEK